MQRLQAARRFDTHRQEGNTINPLSKVCPGLPEECYDTAFLSQHDELARLGLRIQSKPSHLDDAIHAVSERRI
jgi:mitochondrial fission protein ELM1